MPHSVYHYLQVNIPFKFLFFSWVCKFSTTICSIQLMKIFFHNFCMTPFLLLHILSVLVFWDSVFLYFFNLTLNYDFFSMILIMLIMLQHTYCILYSPSSLIWHILQAAAQLCCKSYWLLLLCTLYTGL